MVVVSYEMHSLATSNIVLLVVVKLSTIVGRIDVV